MKITAISGYDEVGRNMTLFEYKKTRIILDMGLELDNYIIHSEDNLLNKSKQFLIENSIIPKDTIIQKKSTIDAIIPTHGHLDHIGAIQFMAKDYKNATIYATKYTGELLKTMLFENKVKIPNKIKIIPLNSKIKIKDLEIEFINVTHSIPDTALIAMKTEKGYVIYLNDYKIDPYPIIGKKTNFKRLKELGKEGVYALIIDGLRSLEQTKSFSETTVKYMLRDVLQGTYYDDNLIVITTFASHIARIKSIISLSKDINREIVFAGRSLFRYLKTAEKIGLIDLEGIKLLRFPNQIKKFLKEIEKKDLRNKYLIVMTGHQGEPGSVLDRLVNNQFKFKLRKNDIVIFSSRIIPNDINFMNRHKIEEKLKEQEVRIYRDIHVSGHASKEDSRDILRILKPKHIIPAHGPVELTSGILDLANEMNIECHILKNSRSIEL